MKLNVIIVLLILISSNTLLGQNSRVISGISSFERKDFKSALQDFNAALEYPEELSATNLTKAYFYRSRTIIYQYNNAVLNNDEATLDALVDPYLSAYEDLRKARESDNGSWELLIKEEMLSLVPGLIHYGLFYLSISNDPQLPSERVISALENSRQHAEAVLKIQENYIAYDLSGQVLLKEGKKREAKLQFERAIYTYEGNIPEKPDFMQAYVYIRLASITREEQGGPNAALQYIDDGISRLIRDYSRWERIRADVSDEDREQMEQDYKIARNDLQNFRYDLFIKHPDLRAKAQMDLAEEVERNPYDYDIRVAYAGLFEDIDMEKAIQQYKEAIKIDSAKDLAYFNIGVLYFNKARDNYQQAGVVYDEDKYVLLMTTAESNFKEAIPWFEKSLQLDPSNLSAIIALKDISFLLNRKEDYERYREMESLLK